MKRREFITSAGLAALGAAFSPSPARPAPLRTALDAPLYDTEFFEAAERFVFLSPQEAVLSLAVKPGRELDVKLFKGQTASGMSSGTASTYRRVRDVLDIPLAGHFWGPEFHYRLEFKDATASSGWRTTPARRVKTPRSYQETRRLEVIIAADDHTYDDADMPGRAVQDPKLREDRLSGEYVNHFLRRLDREPSYVPDEDSDEAKVRSGYGLAKLIHLILERENPDLMFVLGDSTGIGAGYKWSGLGLKDPGEASAADYDAYARLFWLRMRRMYSALTPRLPVYLVLGNHDGESGYDYARPWALAWRKTYFRQPGALQGQAIDENFFCLPWGNAAGGENPHFIVLDNEAYNPPPGPLRPEDWTLGVEQKVWLEHALEHEARWKFAFSHHVLGGWPRGTHEGIGSYAYGRGPLFTAEDYAPYCSDPGRVEQVELTRIMSERGVKAHFYGHDHIHFVRKMDGLLTGVCVGPPKPVGELAWYKGELWKKHYGCYGHYQTEPSRFCDPADFWGPSGYAKLILTPSSAVLEYKRAAYNHPHTNLPREAASGDLIRKTAL
ncbi:MAG: metallophosphoesterase [Candidatus Aminicenantes bacterium]|nr:metallophosphoesterase [Candidatus Aminicenantes bacterium]